MNWTEMLTSEMEQSYKATRGLLDQVDEGTMDWTPSTGENWMKQGQLLRHIVDACGAGCRGFVTGDWGFPEGVDPNNLTPEQMTPPVEAMPAVQSLDETRKLLEADRKIALEMLAKAGEERLANEPTPAPWDPTPMPLGQRLLSMVHHLITHKSQLFYYLKLQGKGVNTSHLWGM